MDAKVIFTNIDGCLNPGLSKRWSQSSVSWYNKIIELGWQTVVSSTWRISKTVPQLQEIFLNQGVNTTIIGTTSWIIQSNEFTETKDRGLEILEWVQLNKPIDWIVCDDRMLDIAPHIEQKRLFWIDPMSGFNENVYNQIRRYKL